MASEPKPPFDPVWGAWILLLAMVIVVIVGQTYIFAGCMLGATGMCTRPTENLSNIAMEILTAVAILVGVKRP
jgi:hypothetical protein